MISNWQYTDQVQHVLSIAEALAKEYGNSHVSAPHLFKALLHNDVGLKEFLKTIGKTDIHYYREWCEFRIENLPKAQGPEFEPTPDKQLNAVFKEADLIRAKLAKEAIDPISILAALLKPDLAFDKEQLKTLYISPGEVLKAIPQSAPVDTDDHTAKVGSANQQAISKYCLEKTKLAREGKLDPVIGRDREIQTICEVMGRRGKSNVILIGEPGVGKTALINGLATRIFEERIPTYLRSAKVFELDTQSLIAGASYKGEFEDRLKSVIDAIKSIENAILFIDEIHTLFGNSDNSKNSAVDLIKPFLTRGELKLIGATTAEEYRQKIESDRALVRRFEILYVDEPNHELAFRMLKQLSPNYEAHHKIKLPAPIFTESIRLATRYIKDRRLPDSAIDLIDQSLAGIKYMNDTGEKEANVLSAEFDKLEADYSNNSNREEYLSELAWFYKQLDYRIKGPLVAQAKGNVEIHEEDSSEIAAQKIKRGLDNLKRLASVKREAVESTDLAAVVADKTGIPIGKIQENEREKLLRMEEWLKRRVIGQDYAIRILSDAVRESRANLKKPGQPIGSFFLLGKTGTGKTELAKTLAAFLFDTESSLLRFDMSEFKEEHSAALLYGAPPGYVGYKEGGLLVNKIREKPFAVVLFDEIEKAHKSVFDVFLQILDEGRLTDKLGRMGDFSNAIILFTSNIGSHLVPEVFKSHDAPDTSKLINSMSQFFRPEFLGRLTDILPFAELTREHILSIIDIQLKSLYTSLEEQGITFEIQQPAKENLALRGYSSEFGARPLGGVIRQFLKRPLSRMIISGELARGSKVIVSLDSQDELKISYN